MIISFEYDHFNNSFIKFNNYWLDASLRLTDMLI